MDSDWSTMVAVGRIARAHGRRGEVIVDVQTDFVEERFGVGTLQTQKAEELVETGSHDRQAGNRRRIGKYEELRERFRRRLDDGSLARTLRVARRRASIKRAVYSQMT